MSPFRCSWPPLSVKAFRIIQRSPTLCKHHRGRIVGDRSEHPRRREGTDLTDLRLRVLSPVVPTPTHLPAGQCVREHIIADGLHILFVVARHAIVRHTFDFRRFVVGALVARDHSERRKRRELFVPQNVSQTTLKDLREICPDRRVVDVTCRGSHATKAGSLARGAGVGDRAAAIAGDAVLFGVPASFLKEAAGSYSKPVDFLPLSD